MSLTAEALFLTSSGGPASSGPEMEGMAATGKLGVRGAYLSPRPWSFTMTFSSVAMGALLAALGGAFSPLLYLVTLVGMICFHGATNVLNDYYDVRHGVDNEGVPTARYRLHPGAAGDVPIAKIRNFALGLYAVTLLAASYLSLVSGVVILVITCAGILGSVFYTADPVVLKAKGVGEVTVFLMWGLLIPLGSYAAQTGSLSWVPVVATGPVGMLVALVLLANNIRDIQYDGSVNTGTIAVRLGQKDAVRFYNWLLASAYAFVAAEVLTAFVSAWSVLVFLSLPGAMRLWRMFRGSVPDDAAPKTAALALQFSLLYMASLVLAILVHVP